MKDVVKMWKYPSMVGLTAIIAAIYMLGLMPFKAIPIIPGYTEIRPASLFPVLSGLLFGPAGAWGSAIGNLLGDFFGTFSLGSIFGFFGNFLYAYIPYKIWGKLEIFSRESKLPTIDSPVKLIEYGVVSVTASSACSLVIAWGIDILKLVPFASLSIIIMLNNMVMTMVFGPVLLPVLYPRIKKLGLLWTDILAVQDEGRAKSPRSAPIMILTGSIGGLAAGLVTSLAVTGQTFFKTASASGGAGNLTVCLVVLPFLFITLLGAARL